MNELQALEGPALIAALLIGVGKILKTWEKFPDRLIPSILVLLGIGLNCWRAMTLDFAAVAVGFGCGASAVWGNQWFRQTFSAQPGSSQAPLPLILVGVLTLGLFTGCTTALKSDKIVLVKSRWFGINITATTETSQTPKIRLGWGSEVFAMIPTATNQPINAPKVGDTFELGQGLNPFSTSIKDNLWTGDVEVRTNATGGAIIPKGPVAPMIPAQPK